MISSKNMSILNVGSGPGYITRFLLDLRPDLQVSGIDISANMIDLAIENNPEAVFLVMNGRQIQLPARSFNPIGFFTMPGFTQK